eukprot:CAMPEP_0175954570 /NCGR_PEP_ID=MMETSP0108-20121206/31997_1 /TAXON_ID=195067 ORGANISM="Goniomonas pacifica, Strain CCMP1869" /NCGR_SAMPLE_ID=MMETSP0108 /ASSEMBLY_ACC=CAM_ASM_000204 /LENGTH=135 /DNA_ID=CAMNT_0017281291 /DNA_START=268 /DNA_END=675 /DNA_ORIENTATION=-
MGVIVLVESNAFFLVTVPPDWGNVEHSIAELNESPSFHWDFEICDVVKSKVDEPLQVLFSQVCLEALDGELLLTFESDKAILRERIVKEVQEIIADLLLRFDEIRAANHADRDLLLESTEELAHWRLHFLLSMSQ